jgi:hypothetical protein
MPSVTYHCHSSTLTWDGLLHKEKGKVVPVHAMQDCTGSGDIAPLIVMIATWQKWVANLTPRALYPTYPLTEHEA